MLEKHIEKYLVDQVRKAGGIAYKFTSPARRGVPDRLVVLPPGKIVFVELKRPGGKLTTLQRLEQSKLLNRGCVVETFDSKESIDEFLSKTISD